MMSSFPVYRFTCGHVGRDSEGIGKRAKVRAFIRVAAVRQSPALDVPKNCPDCKKG